jgi:hypothetical protein
MAERHEYVPSFYLRTRFTILLGRFGVTDRQCSVRRFAILLLIGVHALSFSVMQLVICFYIRHLKKMLEIFCLGSQTHDTSKRPVVFGPSSEPTGVTRGGRQLK